MNTQINDYSEEITNSLRYNLEALILVGSYSRKEGIEGLSDIEFWAILKDLSKANELHLKGKVSLGFTTRKHLKKLKPYIYTVEVKKFGKVLYGDRDILNSIPDYSYEDIKLIDSFILLNNRIVEQLILLNRIEDNQIINQYDFDKGYIQLVNSILVLKNHYRSIYPEKLEMLRMIYNDSALLNKAELAFASLGALAKNTIRKDDALNKWKELREHFKKVWLEEIEILGSLKCWFTLLITARPIKFFVYRETSRLYFSNRYSNRKLRNRVIKKWEQFVK